MKGVRSLFRLGALAMISVLLIVALTVPAAAADEICHDDQMLDEVEILSVTPLEYSFSWDASELLSYGDGAAGTYPTGQLEVVFRDINTAYKITHYDVIATPSDEPGVSKELGIDEVVTEVSRPGNVGSTVTAVLDLEPGTNYGITVVANYYSVQTSPEQPDQDRFSGTTFLSPPFLGGGVALNLMLETDASPSDQGVHYIVYKHDQELHTLRWLNPETFGPFDHKWKVAPAADDDTEGADILCTNKDGDLEDDCADDDGVGLTHYRVTVIDDNGNTEYIETVEISRDPVYTAEFNLNDGTYTFAVDAGYIDDGKFYALSDKAQVEFDIPDDYTKWNQTNREVNGLLDDIADTVAGEEDDFDAFYDSDWDYEGFADDGSGVLESGDSFLVSDADIERNRQDALIIYLNNLYN